MDETILTEILNTLKDFRAEQEERWEKNEHHWVQNEKRWEENERRWTENDIDKFNLKKEFQRFIEIVDQNFASLSKKLDDFIKYSHTIHNKLELRLKKIEANQRYFEKVQESHQETIDIQNVRIDKLSSKI